MRDATHEGTKPESTILVDARGDNVFATIENQTEIERAERDFDRTCRDWDEADSIWIEELYACGGNWKKMDPQIHSKRFAAGKRKRRACYRLKLAEYEVKLRKIKPCDPEDPDCTDSPYYGTP